MNKLASLCTFYTLFFIYLLINLVLICGVSSSRSSNKLCCLEELTSNKCPWLKFTTSEIVSYQLNYSLPELTFLTEQSNHATETIELGRLSNSIERQLSIEGYRLCAYNLLISNRIGLLRRLPDSRNRLCTEIDAEQIKERDPQSDFTTKSVEYYVASIIICYYNEPPSALLRTIWSVLARSPPSVLHEIIVVDDFSEPEFHFAKIKPFIANHSTTSTSNKVRLLRTSKREGLIRARLFGASQATGSALVFLDSHVEPNSGWLEPLLNTLRESNGTTIACPMIDLINADTLIYSASPMVKGGLTWNLHFKWDSVPANRLRDKHDFVRPIESPTMAGGLYAIDRHFFHHLGAYDPGMDLWGGENIELSLRVWMCGGRILILPCSRVGHIFRKRRPYGPAAGSPDTLLMNSIRAAQVWLDGQYLDRFYEANPGAEHVDAGSVQDRLELRQRLKCHNFTWFLENVYPEMDAPTSKDTERPKLFNVRPKMRGI